MLTGQALCDTSFLLRTNSRRLWRSERRNPGAFPNTRPIFQQPFSLPESGQTLARTAFHAGGKSENNFSAASKFARKPFQQGLSELIVGSLRDSHVIHCASLGIPFFCVMDGVGNYIETSVEVVSVTQRTRPYLKYYDVIICILFTIGGDFLCIFLRKTRCFRDPALGFYYRRSVLLPP